MPAAGSSKKIARRISKKSDRPFGRDDVVAAVIGAAGELFSRHGFDGVSVRDIAKRAGVNHGLIHRHFGSKENLRRQTLQYMADAMLADVQDAGTLDELSRRAFLSLKKHEGFWRILARTILDGYGTGELHKSYPIAQHLIERVTAAMKEGTLRGDIDPRMIVASMFSFSCGFIMFEPFILSAAGLDGMKPDDVREKIFSAAISLLEGRKAPKPR
ncbi:MAG TPA: TetR/AcrR family transcriptional regulator [Spirochaetota bacterium]|nr:TetR/AcrR family transcriptional regulator [Spirochaetota bacterium]HOD16336.1 TetR/AcrR family transcriptional regulator [Spirochaetota bacterium]HPG50713.1 TetR/AcrR family transcriptional regulator [Spirochaetota bacterium]HPN12137.1 TetR/AcrR family transcriptional regulator [Spirochaetota bacterium]